VHGQPGATTHQWETQDGNMFNHARRRLRRLNQTVLTSYNSSDYANPQVKAIEARDLAVHVPKNDPEALSSLVNLAAIQEGPFFERSFAMIIGFGLTASNH
jgi:hypothetical protein